MRWVHQAVRSIRQIETLLRNTPSLSTHRWQADKNEMFVLLNLVALCIRCVLAPLAALHQPAARTPTAHRNGPTAARTQTRTLVPIHSPTLRRHV
jgi:hypothetical protein